MSGVYYSFIEAHFNLDFYLEEDPCYIDDEVVFDICFAECADANYFNCELCLNNYLAKKHNYTETRRRKHWCITCETYRSPIYTVLKSCRSQKAPDPLKCVTDRVADKPILCVECVPHSVCYFEENSDECKKIKAGRNKNPLDKFAKSVAKDYSKLLKKRFKKLKYIRKTEL